MLDNSQHFVSLPIGGSLPGAFLLNVFYFPLHGFQMLFCLLVHRPYLVLRTVQRPEEDQYQKTQFFVPAKGHEQNEGHKEPATPLLALPDLRSSSFK